METLKAICTILGILLIFPVGPILLMAWSIRADMKTAELKEKAIRAALEAELADHMKMPKSSVVFVLDGGSSTSTDLIYPKIGRPGNLRYAKNRVFTSLELAKELERDFYESGKFTDKNGFSYPVHQVIQSNVKTETGN